MMTDQKNDEKKTTEQTHAAKMLEVVGWGLFFIWIGISFLVKFHIGIGLLGVAVITLGTQMARKIYGLKMEGFWIIVGLLFYWVVSGNCSLQQFPWYLFC
jgi:cytochrome c oxidase subunit IV